MQKVLVLPLLLTVVFLWTVGSGIQYHISPNRSPLQVCACVIVVLRIEGNLYFSLAMDAVSLFTVYLFSFFYLRPEQMNNSRLPLSSLILSKMNVMLCFQLNNQELEFSTLISDVVRVNIKPLKVVFINFIKTLQCLVDFSSFFLLD